MKKCSFILYIGILLLFFSCNQEEDMQYLSLNPVNLNDPIPTSIIKITTNNQIYLSAYLNVLNAALTEDITTKGKFSKPELIELRAILESLQKVNQVLKSQAKELKGFIEVHLKEKEYSYKIEVAQRFLKEQVDVQKIEIPSVIKLGKNNSPEVTLNVRNAYLLLSEKKSFQQNLIPYVKETTKILSDKLRRIQNIQSKDEEFEILSKTHKDIKKELESTKADLEEAIKERKSINEYKNLSEDQKSLKVKELNINTICQKVISEIHQSYIETIEVEMELNSISAENQLQYTTNSRSWWNENVERLTEKGNNAYYKFKDLLMRTYSYTKAVLRLMKIYDLEDKTGEFVEILRKCEKFIEKYNFNLN